ncbi:hypothetical protein ACFL0T_06015 [Candidatus Omnitrophota bacterium]
MQTRPQELETTNDLYHLFLNRDYIGGPSKVIAKRGTFIDIGGFDENLRIREDWDIWIRMAKAKYKLGVLHKPLYNYIIRSDGSNLTRQSNTFWIYETYKLLRKYKHEVNKYPDLKEVFAEHLWKLARMLYYEKEDILFMVRLMAESQMLCPSLKRPLDSIRTSIKRPYEVQQA